LEDGNEDVEWFYASEFQRVKELVFGKSQETLELEDFLAQLQNEARNQKKAKRSPHLQAAGDDYTFNNWEDVSVYYSLDLYVGSNSDPISTLFTTALTWTTIPSTDCDECEGNTFDYDASTSFEQDIPYFYIIYGTSFSIGYYVHD